MPHPFRSYSFAIFSQLIQTGRDTQPDALYQPSQTLFKAKAKAARHTTTTATATTQSNKPLTFTLNSFLKRDRNTEKEKGKKKKKNTSNKNEFFVFLCRLLNGKTTFSAAGQRWREGEVITEKQNIIIDGN